MKELATGDPRAHAANVRSGLEELIDHLRRDVAKVSEPKAQTLFETAAEVLTGLSRAFQDYEESPEDTMTAGPV